MFIFIFAANLRIKFEMKKQMGEELTVVDLRDYYHGLSKKEKGMMLRYIVSKFGLGFSTLVNKFAGRLEFTQSDVVLVSLAIDKETEWRR